MKQLIIEIHYDSKGETENDNFKVRCDHKKLEVNITRDEMCDLPFSDEVFLKEYDYFKTPRPRGAFCMPVLFCIKVNDDDYEIVFENFFSYSTDEKANDLSKMYTLLKLKISEVYNDVELYNKYCEGADTSGRVGSTCKNCNYYHNNGYCKRYNIVEPVEICDWFILRKDKEDGK